MTVGAHVSPTQTDACVARPRPVLPTAGTFGRGSSRGGACLWLPPLPFCNFHRALTFRLHSVNTARRPRLPAYIKDMYPTTHLPPFLWRTCVSTDPTQSRSPTAVALPPFAAVCALCSEEVSRRRPIGRRLLVHLPAPSVSSAYALNSPIWAYIIATWSPDGWTANDYLTSP